MDRRVAQGRSPLASDAPPSSSFVVSFAVGCALVAIALVVYTLSHPTRFYNHFEWQALAFLEGHAAIRYPVEATATSPGNAFFQDVLPVPTGADGVQRGLVPFPPLPAVVLMPFVWLWGLATNGQLIFAILGALDVGIAWWMLGRLPIRTWVRVATTVFLGFGTVLWYAAQIGTTWYQAHVLAVGLALAAIGVALGGDRDAARSEDDLDDEWAAARSSEALGPSGDGVMARRELSLAADRIGKGDLTVRLEMEGQVADSFAFGLGEAGRDELAQGLPVWPEHPERRVARLHDLARRVDDLLQHPFQ